MRKRDFLRGLKRPNVYDVALVILDEEISKGQDGYLNRDFETLKNARRLLCFAGRTRIGGTIDGIPVLGADEDVGLARIIHRAHKLNGSNK